MKHTKCERTNSIHLYHKRDTDIKILSAFICVVLLLPLIIIRLVKSVVLLFFFSRLIVCILNCRLFFTRCMHAIASEWKKKAKFCYKYIIDSACRCEGNTIHTHTQLNWHSNAHIWQIVCVMGWWVLFRVNYQANKTTNGIAFNWRMKWRKMMQRPHSRLMWTNALYKNENIVYYFTHFMIIIAFSKITSHRRF